MSRRMKNRDTALLFGILPLRGPRFTYADSEADVISMPMPPGRSITECLIMIYLRCDRLTRDRDLSVSAFGA